MSKKKLSSEQIAMLQQIGRDNWLGGFTIDELYQGMQNSGNWNKHQSDHVITGFAHCEVLTIHGGQWLGQGMLNKLRKERRT